VRQKAFLQGFIIYIIGHGADCLQRFPVIFVPFLIISFYRTESAEIPKNINQFRQKDRTFCHALAFVEICSGRLEFTDRHIIAPVQVKVPGILDIRATLGEDF